MSTEYTLPRRERAGLVSVTAKLGIIGGSGLYALDGFETSDEIAFQTPYGKPSDPVSVGTLAGRRDAFILSLIHNSEPTRLGMIAYALICI